MVQDGVGHLFKVAYNDLYMKSGGSYSIARSVHRDSVTNFNVSCKNGDRHFLYTLLANGFINSMIL